jgi:hypothetical protein
MANAWLVTELDFWGLTEVLQGTDNFTIPPAKVFVCAISLTTWFLSYKLFFVVSNAGCK